MGVSGRFGRRRLLRGTASLLLATPLAAVSGTVSHAAPITAGEADLTVRSGAATLRAGFAAGGLSASELSAVGRSWLAGNGSPLLSLEGVQTGDSPPRSIDGRAGLSLLRSSGQALTLVDDASGLQLALELQARPGSAIVHRLGLRNGRDQGDIHVARATTVALDLAIGEWAEALGADDSPSAWDVIRQPLPAGFGQAELRNADRSCYPLIRLLNGDGTGLLIAVSTATAWRVEIGLAGGQRLLRAGEYSTELKLAPGETAQLPDVVTIFSQGGSAGAVAALRDYLESVSLGPPAGWSSTPPIVFNTWFAYGTALNDNGRPNIELRQAARNAANAGVEVLVVDAGWYVGNPVPAKVQSIGAKDSGDDEAADQERVHGPGDFEPGLGAWEENPNKWGAAPLADGQPGGLRAYADYVHNLDVKRPNGRVIGKMKFGLWLEVERFDPSFNHPAQVPAAWAVPGAPIVDFSRPEVVAGMAERISRLVQRYRVDYFKLDANFGVGSEPAFGRSGHFWTRWSAGFEQLLSSLTRTAPGLYIELCSSGLKRYWIGLGKVAHATWLDDDVGVTNVQRLLDATDWLMLPRQKTVEVTEDLSRYVGEEVGRDGEPTKDDARFQIREVLETYFLPPHQNGGAIGFSSRLERWGPEQQTTAAQAVERWRRQVGG